MIPEPTGMAHHHKNKTRSNTPVWLSLFRGTTCSRRKTNGSLGVRSWTMYMLLSEGNSTDTIQQLTSSMRQMQTLALLSRDLHGNSVVPNRSKRSNRSKPHGSSKFKGSTFNDQTPLPIFRIMPCSEAMDVFFSADDR